MFSSRDPDVTTAAQPLLTVALVDTRRKRLRRMAQVLEMNTRENGLASLRESEVETLAEISRLADRIRRAADELIDALDLAGGAA